MMLLLQPDPQQQKKLDALLTAQQTRGDARFHQWVTAADFADKYALSAKDCETVATWLKSEGFRVAALPVGRGWIEFSGDSEQVKRAFGADVEVAGGAQAKSGAPAILAGPKRYRLTESIKLPAAIANLVQGLVSLDGAESVAASTPAVELKGSTEKLAAAPSLTQTPAMTPASASGRLGIAAVESRTTAAGAGETIAIPSRSNIRAEDFAAFRKTFGLPEMAVEVKSAGTGSGAGSATGRGEDEAATIEAASWAGVAAPRAQIMVVPVASTNATDGVDLALAAIVDGALAHTVSVGYSACEAELSEAHREFYAAVYRQAAAEGIAIVAASGDSGAAACHRATDTEAVRSGLGVNALASTPWNTAVGAVALAVDAKSLLAWQPADASDLAYATGGGASAEYLRPAWQTAPGVPEQDAHGDSSGARSLPDVSLPAAVSDAARRGLAFCFSGETVSSGCRLVSAGGSAAAAAIFSGVATVLAEKYGPQGNLAPNLYSLRRWELSEAKAEPAFEDVANGSARLACVVGTLDCAGHTSNSSTDFMIGFDAGVGYDQASGLGSVNVEALVANWAKPQALGTGAVTVTMTGPNSGTYNPGSALDFSAQVTSGTGGAEPTGTVQFYDESTLSNLGAPVTVATDGSASYTEQGQLTAGGHNVAAIYSGDSTYESAESQTVTLELQPSPTSVALTPSSITPVAGSSITVTGVITPTYSGAAAPSGTLTVNLDGVAQGTAMVSQLSTGSTSSGSVTVTAPASGAHNLQGVYSGDTNYNASTSPAVTITVGKTATVTTLAATPTTLSNGVPETFTATVAPATAASGVTYSLTGTVSFYDGGTTLIGTATVVSNTAILAGVVLSNSAAHTITASYSGDTAYGASVSPPVVLEPVLLPVTVTLSASNLVLAPGQSVSLTAAVTPVTIPPTTAEQHPSGYVLFYAGSTLIGGQSAVTAGPGDSGVATTFVSNLPAGQYALTAKYSGDLTFAAATSNTLSLQAEDFTLGCNANNINVQQGATGTVTCNVASLGGLNGPIQVACEEQNPPTNGAIVCTFMPNGIINGTGSLPLTVVTTSGNVLGQNGKHGSPWPATGGGVTLALVGLLLSPIGRRARWFRSGTARMMLVGLLLVGMVGAATACSSSGISHDVGTPIGVHTLKITAAADVGTVTVSHYTYVTVNVTP